MSRIYEDKAFVDKLDRYLEEHKDQIVEDLKDLVRHKSVRQAPTENCMFGDDTYKCLLFGRELAQKRGFAAELYDGNKYVLADWGEGDRTIGFFSHLDVVPEGDGWMCDPYDPIEYKGLIVGRGTQDNKQAAVEGLYTMMALRDLEVPFHSKIRLFMGGSEESGMEDAKSFAANQPKPDFSIISDAGFPLTQCETHSASFFGRCGTPFQQITDFSGGLARNVVPDNAQVTVKADDALEAELRKLAEGNSRFTFTREGELLTVHAKGESAHANRPEGSLSAFWLLADLLSKAEGLCDSDRKTMAFVAHILGDYYAEALGFAQADDIGNTLHCISGMAHTEEGKLVLEFNSRTTSVADPEQIQAAIEKTFAPAGWTMENFGFRLGYRIPDDDKRLQLCLEMYQKLTGDTEHLPYGTGGGTYVRPLGSDAMVFGGNFPDETYPELPAGQGTAHQTNEAIRITNLLRAIKIYVLTMIELDKLLHE